MIKNKNRNIFYDIILKIFLKRLIMNIYLLVFPLLALVIGTFYLVHHKAPSRFRPLPIVTHLASCVIFIPLVFLALSSSGIQIPQISSQSFLGSFNQMVSSFVLGLILIELSNIKPSLKIVKLAGLSALLPALGALGFSFAFGYISNIPLTVGLVCVFALSAVPVLYLYLKQINANSETIKLFMGAAIAIDLIAWLIFNIISTSFNLVAFICSIAIAFTPFVVKKFARGEERLWVSLLSIVFMMTFTSLFFIKSYALLFGILFLYNLQKTYPQGFQFLPEHWIMNFFNYFAIPFLFVLSAFTISWNNINFSLSIVEMSILIVAPIVLKVLSSYIGLVAVKYTGDKFFGSILLNSRGLTEVVFINTLFVLRIIPDIMYLSLLVMTFIATIAPGIIVKYQMSKNTKKIVNLVRVK